MFCVYKTVYGYIRVTKNSNSRCYDNCMMVTVAASLQQLTVVVIIRRGLFSFVLCIVQLWALDFKKTWNAHHLLSDFNDIEPRHHEERVMVNLVTGLQILIKISRSTLDANSMSMLQFLWYKCYARAFLDVSWIKWEGTAVQFVVAWCTRGASVDSVCPYKGNLTPCRCEWIITGFLVSWKGFGPSGWSIDEYPGLTVQATAIVTIFDELQTIIEVF